MLVAEVVSTEAALDTEVLFEVEPITAFVQEFGLNRSDFTISDFDERQNPKIMRDGVRDLRPSRRYGWTLLQVMFVGEHVDIGLMEEQRDRLNHFISYLSEIEIVGRFREYAEKLREVRKVVEERRMIDLHEGNVVVQEFVSRGLPLGYRNKWFDMNMVGALDTLLNGPKNEVDRALWQRRSSLTGGLNSLVGERAEHTARSMATDLGIGNRADGDYADLGVKGQNTGKGLGRTIEAVGCLNQNGTESVVIDAPSGQITRDVKVYKLQGNPNYGENCSVCAAARVCERREKDALAIEFAGRLKEVLALKI